MSAQNAAIVAPERVGKDKDKLVGPGTVPPPSSLSVIVADYQNQKPRETLPPQEPPRQPLYRVVLPSVAFFGAQLSWAVLVGYTTPTLRSLGMSDAQVGFAWLMAPLSGLIMQPLIGVWSDSCESPLGRRRPFMIAGVVLAVVGLVFFGMSEHLGMLWGDDDVSNSHPHGLSMALAAFLLVDVGIQLLQAPMRALLADTVPASQHHVGNASFAVANGLGKTSGFLCGSLITDIRILYGIAAGAVLVTTIIVLAFVKETPYKRPRGTKNGDSGLCGWFSNFFVSIRKAFNSIPTELARTFLVQVFVYMGWMCTFAYVTDWVGKEVWGGNADAPNGTEQKNMFVEGVRSANIGLCIMAGSSALIGMTLPFLMRTIGARIVWAFCLCVFSGLLIGAHFVGTNHYAAIGIIGGLGLPLASSLTIPWAIVTVSLAQSNDKGLYLAMFHFSHSLPEIFVSLIGGALIKCFDGDISMILLFGGCAAGVAALLVSIVKIPPKFYEQGAHWDTIEEKPEKKEETRGMATSVPGPLAFE